MRIVLLYLIVHCMLFAIEIKDIYGRSVQETDFQTGLYQIYGYYYIISENVVEETNLNSVIAGVTKISAAKKIHINTVISAKAKVNIEAEDRVILQSGFHAVNGSNMRIRINEK